MIERKLSHRAGTIWRGASIAAILVVIAGCRGGHRSGRLAFLERISHANSAAPVAGKMAEEGRAAIAAECAKQSYENARNGLIVSETGLHEDVFALRNRMSYAPISYDLDEALRLDGLLEAEAQLAGQPPEQADCIQDFAEHLETLTDPMVESDKIAKQMDSSAFNAASKEAQEQAEQSQPGAEKPTGSSAKSDSSKP